MANLCTWCNEVTNVDVMVDMPGNRSMRIFCGNCGRDERHYWSVRGKVTKTMINKGRVPSKAETAQWRSTWEQRVGLIMESA